MRGIEEEREEGGEESGKTGRGRRKRKIDSPFTFTFPHFILPTTTFPKIAHRTQFR
jgi:hypothetical protein